MILNANTKIQKLNFEEALRLHGKIYSGGMYFNIVLTPDLEFVISEQEVRVADKTEYPFLDEAKLVYPAQLNKDHLSEEDRYTLYESDMQLNLDKIKAKLDDLKKPK